MIVLAVIADAVPTAAASAEASEVGRGLRMLLALTLLCVVFVVVVALGVAMRRARRLRADAAKKRVTANRDAWAESGRRARPVDTGDPDDD